MAAGCFFHEDRLEFEYLFKELKACRWIPRPYINRLAMAICSCRKKKRTLDENDVERACHFLREIIFMHDTQQTTLSETLIDFLRSSLNGICDESRKRLLCILFETKNNNFHNLTRKTISNTLNLGENILNEKAINKTYIPPESLARLLMKKKKLMSIEKTICLPLHPRAMKLLQKEIKGNFHQFGVKNKCFVELEDSMNLDRVQINMKQTFLRVFCRDLQSLQDIRQQLLLAAGRIQTKVSQKPRTRQKQHIRRRIIYDYNLDDNEVPRELYKKGFLTDDFEKKVIASQRNNTHDVGKKNKSPVLQGGHCLHCLQPFESLKNNSPEACTFHPGFINGYAGRWSCCCREAEESFPTHKEHKDGGCCVAPHVWRVNKKTCRKTNELPELSNDRQDQLLRKVMGCSSKMAIKLLEVYNDDVI